MFKTAQLPGLKVVSSHFQCPDITYKISSTSHLRHLLETNVMSLCIIVERSISSKRGLDLIGLVDNVTLFHAVFVTYLTG